MVYSEVLRLAGYVGNKSFSDEEWEENILFQEN
jgi:hypothetical protein